MVVNLEKATQISNRAKQNYGFLVSSVAQGFAQHEVKADIVSKPAVMAELEASEATEIEKAVETEQVINDESINHTDVVIAGSEIKVSDVSLPVDKIQAKEPPVRFEIPMYSMALMSEINRVLTNLPANSALPSAGTVTRTTAMIISEVKKSHRGY